MAGVSAAASASARLMLTERELRWMQQSKMEKKCLFTDRCSRQTSAFSALTVSWMKNKSLQSQGELQGSTVSLLWIRRLD